MKRTFAYIFSLLLLLVGTSQLSFAQKDGKGSRAGNWFLGLNAGGAWNQSDVCIEPGGGLGFYIGKNIWYSPVISLDLRGRYLWTQTHGQDGERSFLNGSDSLTFTNRLMRGEIADPNNYNLFDANDPTRNYSSTGFVYHNYKTSFHNLSLELRANIEAVYPVWLSFYAGADLGIYRSKTNQFGDDLLGTATTYNTLYEGLDPNLSESDARFDIWAGSDNTYETFSRGDDKWSAGFMPSVGWELGYWFTPRFALGIGHRATFTLKDNFEGVEIAQPKGIKTDIHHYGGLFLDWRIHGTQKDPVPVVIDPNDNVINNPPTKQPPVVNFTQPANSGSSVSISTTTVIATVKHVTDKNSVLFTINGTPTRNFSYNPTTDVFQATVTLQQGSNTFVVTGTNGDGRASDQTVINYQEVKCDPPVVNVTNPRGSPTVNVASADIAANLQYVARARDITLKVNGMTVSNFQFNGSILTAQLNLNQGSNTVSISAKNECGSDFKSFVIRYQPTEIVKNPPNVTITSPTANPYNSPSKTTVITATITNVPTKNGVTFSINGSNTNNFSYSNGSFVASGITLNQGNNIFTIKGTNADGSDTESTIITYNPVIVKNPPVVTITQPNTNPYNSPTATTTVRANITNVPTKAGVTFMINGTQTSNFSYNGNTLVASGVTLNQGNNVFTVTGTNADGSDTKTTIIAYNPVIVKNPPVVTITQPNTNPYNSPTATTTLTANITNVPSKSGVKFTINGTQTGNFSYNGSTLVATGITLNQGSNVFTVTGTNADGSDTKSTVINYNPVIVKNPPVVTITQPNTSPYTVQTATTTLTANITNVPTKSGVTFTINGSTTSNFSYNGSTLVASGITLNAGNNVFTVTGTNTDGSDTKSTIIVYEPIKNPPVVTITQPNTNPYQSPTQTTTLTANITNVPNRSGVTFTINGAQSNNFSYNGTTLTASGITLNQGSNIFTVTGSNADGTDTKSTTIIYKPLPTPLVTITTPNTNPYTSPNANTTIQANILNVPDRSGVTFIVNGQTVTNFSFSGTQFTATGINLNQGTNTFTITGSNNQGSDTKSTTILYNPIQPPTVTIIRPSANPSTITTSTTTVIATITNVPTRSGVSCTINGVPYTGFSYNGSTFTGSGVTMQPGSNTVVITGTNAAGSDTKSTIIIYQQPTPAPVVTITQPNTNPTQSPSATTTIRANITNVPTKSGVTFTINGQATNNFSYSNGVLTASGVTLNQGNNVFSITGTNNAGSDTKSTTISYNPIAPPVVTIVRPSANPSTITSPTTTVMATITNVPTRSGVTFTINGQNVTNFSYNGSTLTASGVTMQLGSNTVVVTGTNAAGSDTKSTVIIYQQPTPAPVVTITQPNTSPYQSPAQTTTIRASITNVPTKSGVTFTINGTATSNFSYSNGTLVASGVTLNQGNNTFTITGTNNAGSDTKSTVIIYKPLPLPVVTITQPNANPYASPSQTTTIRATISSVPTKGGVTFTVNGQNISNFSFTGNQFVANNVNLSQGNNTITIKGTNSQGSDTESTIITYNPIAPPVVKIIRPGTSPTTVTNATTTVMASITNVPTKSGVTFKVNNQNVTNFSYNGSTLTASGVNLQPGSNTITVTGTNAAGSDTKSTVIIYQQPTPAPVVTITQPNTSPYQSPSQTTTIRASITNVPTKSGVTFTVNGQNVTNFSYSNGGFTATGITLNQGNNTFTIKGTNNAGSDTKSTTIIFKPLPAPNVTITQPNANPYTSPSQTTTIRATISSVPTKSGVTFTVNGQNVSSFSFSGNQFTANNVSLNQGNNTITIKGTNSSGSDTESTTIVYSPVAPPVVKFVRPASSPTTVTSPTTTVMATVQNVSSKNNISFKLNNQTYSNFTFSGTSVGASGLTLKPGSNTIKITGTNAGGTDTKSIVINYQQPNPAPTVQITAPANGSRTSGSTTTLRATVQNVPSKNNVTVKVNGQNVNFSLSGTQLTATNVNLKAGNNTLSVQANTGGGSANKSVTVIRQVATPVITITSPKGNPARASSPAITFTASVTNAQRNEVQFIVNGQNYTNFVMKGSSFSATNIKLRNGNNTFNIKANTAGGSANKSIVVVYQPPAQKPTIALVSPTKNSMNVPGTTSTINLRATVNNVPNKSGIAVTINGKTSSNFVLTGSTLAINSVPLRTGNNTVVVRATNSAGTATQTINITRAASLPASKPTIANLKATNVGGKGNLTASLNYVTDKNKITVTVNGQKVTNFSFGKNSISANGLTLKTGTNVFTVTAVNGRGSTTQSTTLNVVANSSNRGGGTINNPSNGGGRNGGSIRGGGQ